MLSFFFSCIRRRSITTRVCCRTAAADEASARQSLLAPSGWAVFLRPGVAAEAERKIRVDDGKGATRTRGVARCYCGSRWGVAVAHWEHATRQTSSAHEASCIRLVDVGFVVGNARR